MSIQTIQTINIDGVEYVLLPYGGTEGQVLSIVNGELAWADKAYKVTEVIDPAVLPSQEQQLDSVNYMDGVEVVLPSEILVTKGDSLQLFYRSMVKSVNPYAFDLLAVASSGRPYPRYFQLDTAYNNNGSVSYLSVGTRQLTVYVRDNKSRNVANKVSTIRIVAVPTSPATQKNILVIGASTIAGGATTKELSRRLTGSDGVEMSAAALDNRTYFGNPKGLGLSNIAFVGRQYVDGIRQDGKSGRKMKDVATAGTNSLYTFYFTAGTEYNLIQGSVYSQGGLQFTVQGSDTTQGDLEMTLTSGSGSPSESGTLTLVSGEGSESVAYNSVTVENSNPFWNGISGKIDFAQYSDTYCNGVDIDIVVSHLGINDIFGTNETIAQLIGYTKSFIRAYHDDFPNGKFVITTLFLPDITGGMGSSYSGSYSNTYWNIATKYWEYNKGIFELAADDEFSPYVIVCSSLAEFDNENLFSHKTVKTSNRSSLTEQIGTNALHYSTPGFTTVADSMYHAVCHALNQINS